jgi:N-acetylglucosaminyl-diphospho-decaprenol L-rhamnosyltransferase
MDKILSIVIITKDTKELLKNLLDSIGKDLSLQPFIDKIIIVDNASIDGTDRVIGEKYPAILYVRNEQNRGFAAAVNKGSSFAESKYVLLLNSDTIIVEGELVKMLSFMEYNADVAVCGPQLVYPDMKNQRSFAAIPSLSAEFFLRRRSKVQGPRFKVENAQENDLRSTIHDQGFLSSSPTSYLLPPTSVFIEVDSLIGAAILIRRDVLEMLNGFDERYFFFLEETDFCVRVRQAGHRVVFLPAAKVIHLQGKTVRKNWIRGRMEYNISLAKFIQKHHTGSYYAMFMTVKLVKALFFVTLFPLPLFGKRIRMKYAYYLTLITWYFQGCPDNAGLRPVKDT